MLAMRTCSHHVHPIYTIESVDGVFGMCHHVHAICPVKYGYIPYVSIHENK